MGLAWSSVSEFLSWARLDDDEEVTDSDAEAKLETAHRMCLSKVGSRFVEWKNLNSNEADTGRLNTLHGGLIEFLEFWVQDTLLEAEDYTVSLYDGSIIIKDTSEIGEGTIVKMVYVPLLFKELEMSYALKSILTRSFLLHGDNLQANRISLLDDQIRNLITIINSSGRAFAVPDHYSDDGNVWG
jgi:hypothetical protein